MKTRRAELLVSLLASASVWATPPAQQPVAATTQAAVEAPATQNLKRVPTDTECSSLPAVRAPYAFSPGETLDYDIDALGAQAAKMSFSVQPAKNGHLPIEARVQTNTFFAKFRRVTALATSYLSPRTLRPARYYEDATENEIRRVADVAFRSNNRSVKVAFQNGPRSGQSEFTYAQEGLDVLGSVYLLRQIPLAVDTPVCFDAYGIRKLWRVYGKVIAREHVSLPVGEFDAWHMAGDAVRLDDHRVRREIHLWISDDERRLPLVAVGALDLGAVRATLTAYQRPGSTKLKAQGKENLKW